MTETHALLADYVQNGSQAAFREIVERYFDLVHSTAARRVGGGGQQASDVAQKVFMDLARSAAKLPGDVQLGGWLHRHTCFVTNKLVREEQRRKARETEAAKMNTNAPSTDANFAEVAPLLDDAINELADDDRTAILLRFFERRDFRSVGEVLTTTEDAARMRVSRAVDKLRSLLSGRGVTISAVALAALLVDRTVSAAPVGAAVHAANHVFSSASLAKAIPYIAKVKLGALAAGGAVVVAVGIALSLSATGAASSAPTTAPATTQAATTAPAGSTFVAKISGSKGMPFKGLIVTDGVSKKVSGNLPAQFTTQGNDVKFAIQVNGKGWIGIDVSENGNSLGSSNTADEPFAGVLATFLRGGNQMNLFTTFDKKSDPEKALQER